MRLARQVVMMALLFSNSEGGLFSIRLQGFTASFCCSNLGHRVYALSHLHEDICCGLPASVLAWCSAAG